MSTTALLAILSAAAGASVASRARRGSRSLSQQDHLNIATLLHGVDDDQILQAVELLRTFGISTLDLRGVVAPELHVDHTTVINNENFMLYRYDEEDQPLPDDFELVVRTLMDGGSFGFVYLKCEEIESSKIMVRDLSFVNQLRIYSPEGKQVHLPGLKSSIPGYSGAGFVGVENSKNAIINLSGSRIKKLEVFNPEDTLVNLRGARIGVLKDYVNNPTFSGNTSGKVRYLTDGNTTIEEYKPVGTRGDAKLRKLAKTYVSPYIE